MVCKTGKYCKESTLSLPIVVKYSECLKDYNLIIQQEDNSLSSIPNYFSDVLAIDFDCAEALIANEEERLAYKSMDSAFAIKLNDIVKVLLVEFKLNYIKNLRNLSHDGLAGKVEGSIKSIGKEDLLCHRYIFIFRDNLCQQARNRLHRMNPRIPNNYIVMSLNDLVEVYF